VHGSAIGTEEPLKVGVARHAARGMVAGLGHGGDTVDHRHARNSCKKPGAKGSVWHATASPRVNPLRRSNPMRRARKFGFPVGPPLYRR